MAWPRHRSSTRWIVGLCLSAVVFLFGILFYFYVSHGLGLYFIGLATFVVVMLFLVTNVSIRSIYRRNSRMFGRRTVTISDAGFVSDHPLGHSETTWNTFDKFRETKDLFLLYQSADLISILPKRVFATAADLEQFRTPLKLQSSFVSSVKIPEIPSYPW
jgi:hypothetical protein